MGREPLLATLLQARACPTEACHGPGARAGKGWGGYCLCKAKPANRGVEHGGISCPSPPACSPSPGQLGRRTGQPQDTLPPTPDKP